jgi:LmbE family N-acetylglucosaminyl deacetylase
MSRRLAVFVAHPDDDAFGITSTVTLHAKDPQFRFTLVLATSGEAGQISDPALATRETLGKVREQEDKDAWRIVGREPDRHEFLRYPDGAVAQVPPQELIDKFAQILRSEAPDVVVTFGPEGITGHGDHIAVGAAATEAFQLVRAESRDGDSLKRLLHLCLPASRLKRFNDEIVARGGEPMDPTKPFQPRGVDDSLVAVVVDGDSVWELKLAALMAHKTQAGDMQIPEDARREALSGETFVQAWPQRRPGEAVLSDVFQGL